MQVKLYTIDFLGHSNLADMERWPVYAGQIVHY